MESPKILAIPQVEGWPEARSSRLALTTWKRNGERELWARTMPDNNHSDSLIWKDTLSRHIRGQSEGLQQKMCAVTSQTPGNINWNQCYQHTPNNVEMPAKKLDYMQALSLQIQQEGPSARAHEWPTCHGPHNTNQHTAACVWCWKLCTGLWDSSTAECLSTVCDVHT